MRFLMKVSINKWLVISAYLFVCFPPWWASSGFSQVLFSGPESWQAHIQLEFSPDILSREPDLDQKLNLIFASQAARQGAAYLLTRQEPSPGGRSYTLSLEGAGGLNQLKKMLALAADPTQLPGDGPMVLELSGSIGPGESLPLSLESNPSTGFIWEITALDAQRVRLREEKSLRAKSPLLGAPMTQTIDLEGLGEGETTLQFTYRRPWLPDQPPIKKTKIRLPALNLAAAPLPPAPPALPILADPEAISADDRGLPALQLAGSFDWRNNNSQDYLPPIRNQGSCGSCWAFGTVAPLEAAIKIKQGFTVDLSEQYLVSCSFGESYDYGCNGGWFAHQYHQWKIPPGEPLTGAVKEADFPYTGRDSVCTPPHAHPQKITNWAYVNPGNPYAIPPESAIKNAIAAYGPVAAAVCAGPAMTAYRGGVFAADESRTVCGGSVNHAIVLVGWDDAENTWIMRNSWGPSWGEGGYMRIKRNVSNIGYAANYVSYTPPPAQFTPTHWIYLPFMTFGQNTCSGPLCNGNFEGGSNGAWTESSVMGWALIMDLGSYDYLGLSNHQGGYAAWLGGDYSETAVLSQETTIPASATHLGFWFWIDSVDSCGYDFATVAFQGTTLATYDLCFTQDTGGWVYGTIDISSYQGQTGVLSFAVTTDENQDLISSLFLDDIAFAVGAAQPFRSRLSPPGAPPALPSPGGIRRKSDRERR